MKRKLVTLALAAAVAISASAMPARRITRQAVTADGNTIEVTLTGDEHFHAWVGADGRTYTLNPSGVAVTMADTEGNALTFDRARALSPRVQTEAARRKANGPNRLSGSYVTRNDDGTVSIESLESQVPHKGAPHVPIILVQYRDIKFLSDDPKADFEDFFMGQGKSAHSYFSQMSGGMYDPQFDVIGPITLPQNRSYYGNNDYWGNDQNLGIMMSQSLQAADPLTDFSVFDNDGNGICDVAIVVYAGVGEAQSQLAEAIWPCQWTMQLATGSDPVYDGVKIHDFAVFNEVNHVYSDRIDGIGTFCHEFSHCLGLPDFYDTRYGGHFGMNEYSLMDCGSYNDNCYTPVGYTAYEKAFMGWINLTEGKPHTKYTLNPLNNPDAPSTDALILICPSDINEYFIFENRNQTGYDYFMADCGMLITHVTYSALAWTENNPNNSTPQRMTYMAADNLLTEGTLDQDLWPKSNATEFTDTSRPSAKTNVGSNTYLGIPVTEITRDNTTGVVTFWVDRGAILPTDTPNINPPADGTPAEIFTVSWDPVTLDDQEVTYTLQIWSHDAALPAPKEYQNFRRGTYTWEKDATSYVKAFSGYTVFGTTATQGALTSPCTLTPGDDGRLTVVCNGKRYGSDKAPQMQLTILDAAGIEVSSTLITLGNDPALYAHMFEGLTPGATYALKVGNKGTKRILLFDIMVFEGDALDLPATLYTDALTLAELRDTPPAEEAPRLAPSSHTNLAGYLTVSGITATTHSVPALPAGTYSYRIKCVPTDTEFYSESPWSDTYTLTVTGNQGIDTPVIPDSTPSSAATLTPVPYRILDGMIHTSTDARLFTPCGTEVPCHTPGLFAPAPGLYLLIAPHHLPAKLRL